VTIDFKSLRRIGSGRLKNLYQQPYNTLLPEISLSLLSYTLLRFEFSFFQSWKDFCLRCSPDKRFHHSVQYPASPWCLTAPWPARVNSIAHEAISKQAPSQIKKVNAANSSILLLNLQTINDKRVEQFFEAFGRCQQKWNYTSTPPMSSWHFYIFLP
jgi:hypothetical protein